MGKRGPPSNKLASLFRLKYRDGIKDKKALAEKMGVSQRSIYVYEHRLKEKLVKKALQVSPGSLDLVCPECLEARVWKDYETGEKSCTACGLVIDNEVDMIHRLSFDETYAVTNPLVFSKGLGSKTDVKAAYRILAKTRNNTHKVEAVTGVVKRFRSGTLSPLSAGRMIREVLVDGGVQDIAERLQQSKDDPKEVARRIVNMFDAIPIRQIMTLQEVHEPSLLRKMKEYCEGWRKENLEAISRFCDPDVFSAALGGTVQKVGSTAVIDPYMNHSPKDLAAACFLYTIKKFSPKADVNLANKLREEVLQYINKVMSPVWAPEKRRVIWNGKRR